MAKLSEGTDFQIPTAAANALRVQPGHMHPSVPEEDVAPPIATLCIMLSNMFEPQTETNAGWEMENRDDVIEECSMHGEVLHIYVDKASPQGNVSIRYMESYLQVVLSLLHMCLCQSITNCSLDANHTRQLLMLSNKLC